MTRRSRRSVLTGVAGGAALLAGCAERGGDDPPPGPADSTTGTPTSTVETPYTASIEPVGEVTFESVPERWVTYKMGYADVAFALGVGDGLVGLDRPGRYLTPMRELFYGQLPDVPVPAADGVTDIRGGGSIDEETFYEMAADLHLLDPRVPKFYFDWSEEDVERISERVAPFFGSFARRKLPRDYRFYSLYEVLERVAQVFQRRDRYDAWVDLHADVQARIEERLPPAEERPSVALLAGGSDPTKGEFFAMDPTRLGYETKQYRDLGVGNALAEYTDDNRGVFTRIDYEALLEADPELVVFHWRLQDDPDAFESEFVEPMREHPVGSEVTAVRNGEIYRGGSAEQGPILSLFQTELFATQQYPDRFGEFPGFGERPADPLFDRERVAAIVRGDLE
ncbi:ABC transporter substrate-binding protein [Natronomonas marina]|uniref:ABC transporter substrate-binding protein n=1 Tax=Natronomonas marina TaxID=2961939 RepID=UPI0020C9A6CB|nr:ABC transporter substrate-binding protein [Natronomonas marina]